MSDDEYNGFVRGCIYEDTFQVVTFDKDTLGWCYNIKGFISERWFVEHKEHHLNTRRAINV